MENFRKLGIKDAIIKSLQEHNFKVPSEIQEKAIPLVLQGKDIIAGSATGSGKTLAFSAGIIQNLQSGYGIQALILTPTRELAGQISKALIGFSKYNPLEITTVYGGVSIDPQIKALARSDVVIGTPGRVLDHINRDTINLNHVKILVLDEADRMLDMGFIDDVKQIIKQCPEKRQTLLFSATISPDIIKIADNYMNNPIEVSAEVYVDPSKLKQIYYDIEDNMKFSLLVHLLKKEQTGLVMVFCNTQHNTDFVTRNLRLLGIDALGIHGGLSQNKRESIMKQFHSQKVSVLVCTDVAARGLDIKGVSHVYNYDIPKESKQYVHRIGRTARAGKEGKVVNILASRDYDNFKFVRRDNSEFDIIREETPEIERVNIAWKERPRGFHDRNDGRGRRFGGSRRSSDRYNRSDRNESRGRRFGSNRRPNRNIRHSSHSRHSFSRRY